MAKLTTLKVGENKVPIVFSIRADLSVFLLKQLNLVTIQYNFLCHKNYAAVINMVMVTNRILFWNQMLFSPEFFCQFPLQLTFVFYSILIELQ